MSTQETKPRPRPKTVEEWRDVRRRKYRNAGRNGGFRILPTKVLDSDAFNELSNTAKLALILSLSQLDHWRKNVHRNVSRRESSIGPLRNDGRFSLPSNLLKERGIRGSDTIAKARRELGAVGFWETVETGTLKSSGVFRWSDNWLKYNQRPAKERKQLLESAKAPGYCLYPNIIQHNDSKRAQQAERSPECTQQVNHLTETPDSGPRQLELFPELAA